MVRRCFLGFYAGQKSQCGFQPYTLSGICDAKPPNPNEIHCDNAHFDYGDFGLLSVGVLFSCALCWAAAASWLSARQVQYGFLLILLALFCYDSQYQRKQGIRDENFLWMIWRAYWVLRSSIRLQIITLYVPNVLMFFRSCLYHIPNVCREFRLVARRIGKRGS